MESTTITPTVTARTWLPKPRGALTGATNSSLMQSVRFSLAIALSGLITYALWHRVPGSLSASTDIVGYPIFANFDIARYFDAFDLIVFVFPLLVVLSYHGLAWRGPLRKPQETRALRPVVSAGARDGSTPRGDLAPSSVRSVYGFVAAVARLALPAGAVALEVSSARAPGASVPTTSGVVSGIAYLVVVIGASVLTSRVFMRDEATHQDGRTAGGVRAATIMRSGAGLVVVPLLFFVSRSTSVTVQSDHRVVHYPWLPAWFVLSVSAVLLSWFLRRVSRARTQREIESTGTAVLTFVVGPILLFLCVTALPGAFGLFGGFDDGQGLSAAQLTFHGFFPWKDLFFIHGLLADVFDSGVGMLVFSNSRWGSFAGSTMFVYAITFLGFYYFAAYFARRNRLLVLGVSAAIVLGLLGGFADRFAFAPILLILFDTLLRRRSRLWSGVFMAVLVVEAILTPEVGLLALGLIVTLFLFEWFGRTPGTAIAPSFFRTLWCLTFGLAFTAVWFAFLAAAGALSGFIDYFIIFGPGHTLSGAIPTQWSLLHQPAVTVEFFLPVILLLLTIWRSVAKIRGRRPWTTRDWTMVAAATWVALYYGKGLGRADPGHVGEVFTVALPLVLLWVIELLAVGDRFVFRLGSRRRVVRIITPRRLATSAAVVAVLAIAPQPLSSVMQTADRVRTVVPAEPVVARLGYSVPGAIDAAKVEDLRAVLDRYAGAEEPVFDFTNDPGIIYYLLGRVPATRFYHVSMAISVFAQDLLISELRRSRPALVVFSDPENGLAEWDGVINMVRHYAVSQYILDHYVPLVDVDGTLIMLRSDLSSHAPPLPPVQGSDLTSDLYFDAPTCAFGDTPNFLNVPGHPIVGTAVQIRIHVVGHGVTTVTGWAVDHSLLRPAREIVAVSGGRVVATAVPGVARPDVAQTLESSRVLVSGFTLVMPEQLSPLQVYSLNSDNTMSPLGISTTVASSVVSAGIAHSVRTSDDVLHRVTTEDVRGSVDSGGTTSELVVSLDLPSGTRLSSYQWLELRATRPLPPGSVVLTDIPGNPSHEITFNTLPTTHTQVSVPVGSCQQWHGYRSSPLLLLPSVWSVTPTFWLAH